MYKMYTAIHPKGLEIVVDISGMREWTGWVCHPYSHNVCVAKKGMQHCVFQGDTLNGFLHPPWTKRGTYQCTSGIRYQIWGDGVGGGSCLQPHCLREL